MWDYIDERVRRNAEYIVATGCTVRACSAHFQISKSTVHKDVSERLRSIDGELYERVRAILDKNLNERHIRGGIATKRKYLVRSSEKDTESVARRSADEDSLQIAGTDKRAFVFPAAPSGCSSDTPY